MQNSTSNVNYYNTGTYSPALESPRQNDSSADYINVERVSDAPGTIYYPVLGKERNDDENISPQLEFQVIQL
jgi:hypothetical protein